MTANCSFPVKWGDYGDERGYWKHLLLENNIAHSETDSLEALKEKWRSRPPAKFKAPVNVSPSKSGQGLPAGTPYAYDPITGNYKKAGKGGVYNDRPK